VRREVYCWDWYEWDTWTRVCIDMTGTPSLALTLIWLRRPKIFWTLFLSVSQSQVRRIEKREQKFFERLSHICARLGQGVSVILVSMVSLASQSYRSHLGHFDAVILGTPYMPRIATPTQTFVTIIWETFVIENTSKIWMINLVWTRMILRWS